MLAEELVQLLQEGKGWLVIFFRVVMLGEINQDIRAIAVGYSGNGELLIRYFLDRKLIDFDR